MNKFNFGLVSFVASLFPVIFLTDQIGLTPNLYGYYFPNYFHINSSILFYSSLAIAALFGIISLLKETGYKKKLGFIGIILASGGSLIGFLVLLSVGPG